MIKEFKDIIHHLDSKFELSFKKEIYNQVTITLTNTETNKSAGSVLPIDHHLEIDRIQHCIEFLENKLKETVTPH